MPYGLYNQDYDLLKTIITVHPEFTAVEVKDFLNTVVRETETAEHTLL